MPSNADLVELVRPISTSYVFGGTRYGVYDTDCSGMVCGAFWRVFGLDPYELGVDTGSQWASAATAEVWRGTSPDLPWDKMQEGDLIFSSIYVPDFSTGEGSHVGFYTGDPDAPFLSHFCDGGPYVTAVNGVYGGAERYFGVKRYEEGATMAISEEDVQRIARATMLEILCYKNEGINGDNDFYELHSTGLRLLRSIASKLDEALKLLKKAR